MNRDPRDDAPFGLELALGLPSQKRLLRYLLVLQSDCAANEEAGTASEVAEASGAQVQDRLT